MPFGAPASFEVSVSPALLQALTTLVKTGWITEPVRRALLAVDDRALEESVLPFSRTLRALEYFQPHQTRLIILGQDPYHTPQKANGLAFGVQPGFRRGQLRDSLTNILIESNSTDTSLESWAEQGVLLLNTALTVPAHKPGAHVALGWYPVVTALLRQVPNRAVFLLWGSHAKRLYGLAGLANPAIATAHPSPISAGRGPRPFIGSNCFAQANGLLIAGSLKPIEWRRKAIQNAHV